MAPMKTIIKSLSPSVIAQLKPTKERYRVKDKQTKCLYLYVNPGGKMTWYYVTTLGGKLQVVKIGPVEDYDYKDVRAEVAGAQKGRLPGNIASAQHPKRDGDNAATFGKIAADWLDVTRFGHTARSGQKTRHEANLRLHLLPVLASRPIGEITARDMLGIYAPLKETLKKSSVDKVIQTAGGVFDHAIEQGFIDLNPAQNAGFLRKQLRNVRARPAMSHPSVPIEEAPRFFDALYTKAKTNRLRHSVTGQAALFIMLTGCRCSEATGSYETDKSGRQVVKIPPATWREIDLENEWWIVGGERTKNGYTHIIPLSRQAIEVLEDTKARTKHHGPDDIIFPTPIRKRRSLGILSENTITKYIKDLGFLFPVELIEKYHAPVVVERPPVTHGLRATFTDFGINTDNIALASKALGHYTTEETKDKVLKNYIRTTAVEKRRPLMQQYADYLSTGKRPPSWQTKADPRPYLTVVK